MKGASIERTYSEHDPDRSARQARWRLLHDGAYFYLYVIFDIFSRRVVGWCVADAENTVLFKALFDDAFAKHCVPPGN
jgi:transposase InsO family protein